VTELKTLGKRWADFPHDAKAYQYGSKALAGHWERLHRGDGELFPTSESIAARVTDESSLAAREIASRLVDGWRAFHRGDFRRAYDLGTEVGSPGFAVAIKALGVYATYLESDDAQAQALLLAASQQAEQVGAQFPNDANAHYLYAFALGRYSQRISILEALSRGLAPKIEHALQHALKLNPQHADAHIATGLYHAEIIGKLGSLAGGLTYGVSGKKAIDHFRQARKLNPNSPTPKLEYAHGLKLIDDDANGHDIVKLLEEAAHCRPMDAMEKLDCERARELLEKA
jgi:hypothetical protein